VAAAPKSTLRRAAHKPFDLISEQRGLTPSTFISEGGRKSVRVRRKRSYLVEVEVGVEAGLLLDGAAIVGAPATVTCNTQKNTCCQWRAD
jgi:hypothetical protein